MSKKNVTYMWYIVAKKYDMVNDYFDYCIPHIPLIAGMYA